MCCSAGSRNTTVAVSVLLTPPSLLMRDGMLSPKNNCRPIAAILDVKFESRNGPFIVSSKHYMCCYDGALISELACLIFSFVFCFFKKKSLSLLMATLSMM